MRNKIFFFDRDDILFFLFTLFFGYFFIEILLISLKINNFTKSLPNKSLINFLEKPKKIDKKLQYKRTITSMKPNLKYELINFKKDNMGTIYPSSFSELVPNKKNILFCGGSTLEASQVLEGKRPTDVYSNITGIKSLNFSKSNQSLIGCIKNISFYRSYLKTSDEYYLSPSKYVIATNINTLSQFMRENFNKKKSKNKKIKFFGLNTYSEILKKFNYLKREFEFGIKISHYEHSLLDGCCFAPSDLNKSKYGKMNIDWGNSSVLVKNYSKFLRERIMELNIILQEFNIDKKQIVFLIEPNSFNLKKQKVFRKYWGTYDSRQKLHFASGKSMNNKESSIIIQKFNDVYSNILRSNEFKVLIPNSEDFPDWSFYDAVHFTDYGANYLGNYLANYL